MTSREDRLRGFLTRAEENEIYARAAVTGYLPVGLAWRDREEAERYRQEEESRKYQMEQAAAQTSRLQGG